MDWTAILTLVIKTIVELAVAAAGVAATAWLKKKAEQAQDAADADARRELLLHAEDTVAAAVDYVKQTLVTGIKGTEAWTDEAQKDALAEAKAVFYSIMGGEGIDAMGSVVDNVQMWLTAKIEQRILGSKSE